MHIFIFFIVRIRFCFLFTFLEFMHILSFSFLLSFYAIFQNVHKNSLMETAIAEEFLVGLFALRESRPLHFKDF